MIGACFKCNNGFSIDEEYVACLIEATVSGSVDQPAIRRERIAAILARSPSLAKRLNEARTIFNERVSFRPEIERVKRVLMKLAIGHAAYELSQECRDEPSIVWWQPLHLLSQEEQDAFNSPVVMDIFGEVGSRNMQRLLLASFKLASKDGEEATQNLILNDWVEVQAGRYRFHASDEGHTINIRMVIGEYLAAEVEWQRQL